MEQSYLDQILSTLPLDTPVNAAMRPPLVLAYVGDTVYDLYVRTWLAASRDASAHALHVSACKFVCAKAQAQAYRCVLPHLSETEAAVCRRGRNARVGTVPKNASLSDYLAATAFEALLGYLFLSGQDARLMQLMRLTVDAEAAP